MKNDEINLWKYLESGIYPRDAAITLGMHHKRVEYLCNKWAKKGIYDYGVVCDLGWIKK